MRSHRHTIERARLSANFAAALRSASPEASKENSPQSLGALPLTGGVSLALLRNGKLSA
jgi:hypothetical protein